MLQTGNINILEREVLHLHQILQDVKKDHHLKNAIILAFLYRETPKVFKIGIRRFKYGTSIQHSMARAIYWHLAIKHGKNVCKSDLARKFKMTVTNVTQRVNHITNVHEVKIGYEFFIEKSNEIESNLLNFLSTGNDQNQTNA